MSKRKDSRYQYRVNQSANSVFIGPAEECPEYDLVDDEYLCDACHDPLLRGEQIFCVEGGVDFVHINCLTKVLDLAGVTGVSDVEFEQYRRLIASK